MDDLKFECHRMSKTLKVRLGQFSDQGKKPINQDFYGAGLAQDYALFQKGVVCAIADGISSSNVSHIASETAVSSFIQDYYSTPDSWSVQTSAQRVINSINSWLFAQTQQSQGRFDKDRGYVCTFSCLVVKHNFAHIFHIGDARIYRIRDRQLEQLTTDHRISLSSEQSYLSRALGVDARVEIDYVRVQVYPDDIFLLMTDGVYEFIEQQQILEHLDETKKNLNNESQNLDLDKLAKHLGELALSQGSQDNLTLQILAIDSVYSLQHVDYDPDENVQLSILRVDEGDIVDGFHIKKILHQSHRSTLYLAQDQINNQNVVIKTLSVEQHQQKNAVERFLLEEWVAHRLNHDYVMRAYDQQRAKSYMYQAFEYVEGETLGAWTKQQNRPLEISEVIAIIEQVAKGLNAFHRLEMLHQDIRPENIMINSSNHIKLIDFGSTTVKSMTDFEHQPSSSALGTLAYMAPEYFIGQSSDARSDQYSLAVLSYYLLTHQLPYGTDVAKCTTKRQLKQLRYQPVEQYRTDIPVELEGALRKALSIDIQHRYAAMSEFIFDLKNPNSRFKQSQKKSFVDRDPVVFWKVLSLILIGFILVLFVRVYI